MPKPKIFAEGTVMYVPRPWMEALDLPLHISHAAVMVIANVKADVTGLLTDRHVPQGRAGAMALSLRLYRQPVAWNAVAMMLASGLVPADAVGVYTWRGGRGGPIIRVEPDGTLTTLGHFRYDPHRDGRGEYIEPAKEAAPNADS